MEWGRLEEVCLKKQRKSGSGYVLLGWVLGIYGRTILYNGIGATLFTYYAFSNKNRYWSTIMYKDKGTGLPYLSMHSLGIGVHVYMDKGIGIPHLCFP